MKWTFLLNILTFSLIGISPIPFCTAQFNTIHSAEPVLLDDEKYQLTSPRPHQKGAIWHPVPFDLSQPFDMTFQAFLGCQKKGAEGLAFVWQQEGLTAIGSDSTGFACKGITPSLAVIIDNYANPPKEKFKFNVEEISLVKDGDLAQTIAGPTIANPSKKNDTTTQCKNREIRVFWDPAAPTLKVFVDGKARLVYRSNIVKKVFNNNPIVYWGFTAATGKYYNTHGVSVTQYPDQTQQENEEESTTPIAAKQEEIAPPMPLSTIPKQAEKIVAATPVSPTNYPEPILGAALDSLSPATITTKKQRPTEIIYKEINRQNVQPSCFGANDGSIYIEVKGSQQPYRFLWEDGSTEAHRKNLTAGAYAFTIVDNNGNSKTDTAHLSNPPALFLESIEAIPNKTDFAWKAVVKGGNPPYTQQRGAIFVLGNAEIKHTPTKVDILNAIDVIHVYETGSLSKANVISKVQNQLITEIGFIIITDESGCEMQYYLKPQSIHLPTQPDASTPPIDTLMASIEPLVTPVDTLADTQIPSVVVANSTPPKAKQVSKTAKTTQAQRKPQPIIQKTVENLAVSYTTRNIPDSLGERRVKTGKRVLVWAEDVDIMVWDSEEVDGDTISLYFNGEWILKEYPLRRKKKKLRVKVEPNADNYLILYAHNEGRRPPNTAALKISDGKRENKIGLSADMHNCDAVNFKLKK